MKGPGLKRSSSRRPSCRPWRRTFSASSQIDEQVLSASRAAILWRPCIILPTCWESGPHSVSFPGCPKWRFSMPLFTKPPQRAYLYAVPYDLYKEHGIRRYGFHRTSHRFVTERAAILLGKPIAECAFVSVHLGNGCSACAFLGGKSVDTTMGLTPLEGLVMERGAEISTRVACSSSRTTGLDLGSHHRRFES